MYYARRWVGGSSRSSSHPKVGTILKIKVTWGHNGGMKYLHGNIICIYMCVHVCVSHMNITIHEKWKKQLPLKIQGNTRTFFKHLSCLLFVLFSLKSDFDSTLSVFSYHPNPQLVFYIPHHPLIVCNTCKKKGCVLKWFTGALNSF